MTVEPIDSFTIAEAARYSGLSVAMLNYLCRTKLIVPTAAPPRGRGRERRFTFGDVVVLRAVSGLLAAGVSVTRLRASLANLRKRHSEITPKSLPRGLLVCDGRQVYLKRNAEVFEELISGQMSFAFVVQLSKLHEEVAVKSSGSGHRRRRRGGAYGN